MPKPEFRSALEVLGAHELFHTADSLSHRMQALQSCGAWQVRERMAEAAAGHRALENRLRDLEHWLDGRLAVQLDLLASGQPILMECAKRS